jgi:EAL domain-containing protein (putative c-di-GMP-specific phosphodiesterase class I)
MLAHVAPEWLYLEARWSFLRRLDCDAAQGFLLARPQAAAEFGIALE